MKDKQEVNRNSIQLQVSKVLGKTNKFYECAYLCQFKSAGKCKAFYIASGSCREVSLRQSLVPGGSGKDVIYSSIDFHLGK